MIPRKGVRDECSARVGTLADTLLSRSERRRWVFVNPEGYQQSLLPAGGGGCCFTRGVIQQSLLWSRSQHTPCAGVSAHGVSGLLTEAARSKTLWVERSQL
jgi:hypothetical protein